MCGCVRAGSEHTPVGTTRDVGEWDWQTVLGTFEPAGRGSVTVRFTRIAAGTNYIGADSQDMGSRFPAPMWAR